MTISDKMYGLTWKNICYIVWYDFCCGQDCEKCKLSINDDKGKHVDCAYCRMDDVITEFLSKEEEK